MTNKSHVVVHWAFKVRYIFKALMNDQKMKVSQKINRMNHVGLSHNPNSQLFYDIIQVGHPILHNPTRYVCNHINKL